MVDNVLGPGEAPEPPESAVEPRPHRILRSGSGRAWAGVAGGAVMLAALIVFIAENSSAVHVTFLSFHAKLALGLALLVAALAGGVLVFIVGTVRILALRRVAKKHAVEDVAAFRKLGRAVARRRAEGRSPR